MHHIHSSNICILLRSNVIVKVAKAIIHVITIISSLVYWRVYVHVSLINYKQKIVAVTCMNRWMLWDVILDLRISMNTLVTNHRKLWLFCHKVLIAILWHISENMNFNVTVKLCSAMICGMSMWSNRFIIQLQVLHIYEWKTT